MMSKDVTFNGGDIILFMMLLCLLVVSLYYLRGWYFKYMELLKEKHKDDEFLVTVEDLIPLRFKSYDFRVGNIFFTVTKVTPKSLNNELVDGLGMVRLKKLWKRSM